MKSAEFCVQGPENHQELDDARFERSIIEHVHWWEGPVFAGYDAGSG